MLRLLLFICVAALFTGCQHLAEPPAEEQKARAVAILNARRPESLKSWEHKKIRGEVPLAYALSRIGLLLPPGMKMTVRRAEASGGMRRYDAKFTSNGNGFFAGCAVPVTSDGYFVTAAHCAETAAATLVVVKEGGLCTAQTRVVWCGRKEAGEPDLALLHAPISPGATFDVAGLSGPEKGLPVFTAGFGSQGVPYLKTGGSGGRIVSTGTVQERPSGARWREITHDAPMAPGDSGGPVIDERGRLLGINTEISVTRPPAFWFYRGTAECPDVGSSRVDLQACKLEYSIVSPK